MTKTVRLKILIEKSHIKYSDFGGGEELEAFGVSNTEGITRTAHRKSDDLGDYLVIEPGSFAYNPYRVNVGSIGLTPEGVSGVVSPAYVVFRTKKGKLIPEVLLDFLKSFEGLRQINKLARGAVRKALRFEDLCEIEFPALSYERQLQILKHKRGFNLQHGQLVWEITHQQSLLGKLKQAILQEAIQGKLTEDWRAAHPDVEPASQLLHRIQAEKARLIAEKKLRKEKPLPKITPEEIPFEIPKGWEWCPLAATTILRDGERNPISKAERERRGKGFPYYGASGIIDEIDGYTHDGDFLLVGEDGSNLRLRSTPVAFNASGKIWVNNHAHVLEFIEPVLQEFIAHRINGMDIAPFVTGGFQPKLSQENLNRIPIPLPPLAEQAAIVERVEALMTTCRALETEIEQSRTHAAHLLQTVLKEAFAPAA